MSHTHRFLSQRSMFVTDTDLGPRERVSRSVSHLSDETHLSRSDVLHLLPARPRHVHEVAVRASGHDVIVVEHVRTACRLGPHMVHGKRLRVNVALGKVCPSLFRVVEPFLDLGVEELVGAEGIVRPLPLLRLFLCP